MEINSISAQSIQQAILNDRSHQFLNTYPCDSLSYIKEDQKEHSQLQKISSFHNKLYENPISVKVGFIKTQLVKDSDVQNVLIIFLFEERKKQLVSPPKHILGNVVIQNKQYFFKTFNNFFEIERQYFFRFLKESILKLKCQKYMNFQQQGLGKEEDLLFQKLLRFTKDNCILLKSSAASSLTKDVIVSQIIEALKAKGIEHQQVGSQNEIIRVFGKESYEVVLNPESVEICSLINQLRSQKQLQQKSLEQSEQNYESFIQKKDQNDQNKAQLVQLDNGSQGQFFNIEQKSFKKYSQIVDFVRMNLKAKEQIKTEKALPLKSNMKNTHIRQRGKSAKFLKNQPNYAENTYSHQIYINEIIDILKNGHMLALKDHWDCGMFDKFNQIKRNWQLFKNFLRQQIQNVIMMLDFKISQFKLNTKAKDKQTIQFCRQKDKQFNLYELLYPGIQLLVRQYSKLLQFKLFWVHFQDIKIKIFKANLDPKQYVRHFNLLKEHYISHLGIKFNPLDDLIVTYILQLFLYNNNKQGKELQIKWQGYYQPIKKCIYQYTECNNLTSELQDLFSIIKAKVEQLKNTQKQASKLQQFKNIQFHRDQEVRCLGCSQFFQYNKNIFDLSINQTPIKAFPSIKMLKVYESDLKQSICQMLNSKGGVILFGCQGRNKNVFVMGQAITQKNKQDYQQILQHMLRSLYPRIQYNNQIQFTFVPVIQPLNYNQTLKLQTYKGEQNILKTGLYYYEQKYMKGVYVARIRVHPINNCLTYFWESTVGTQTRYYSFISQNSKPKMLKGNQFTKFIKGRFKRNYISFSQKLASSQKDLLNRPKTCFSKPCLSPQEGLLIYEIDNNRPNTYQTKENSYRYMSLLIVKPIHLKEFKQKLSKRTRCFIQQKFRSYNFRSAKYTYILYHDLNFDELLRAVSYSEDFIFQEKMTIVIYISEYLKFQSNNPLSQHQMNCSLKMLRQEFPNERIHFFNFRLNNGSEYYAQTNSRMSTLFMYYYFNDQKIKTFLKSPPRLAELTPDQRCHFWREINYPGLEALGMT